MKAEVSPSTPPNQSGGPTMEPPSAHPQKSVERLGSVDFTKGALVVFMVAYHTLNYSTQYELGFRYLAFLPPSFIWITGFLMAVVYFVRPPSQDGTSSRRMILRGVKLLILFTLLNIAATLVASHNSHGQPLNLTLFFSHWQEVYFLGAGTMAAFEVLLPLAYLLLLGPLLLWLSRRGRWTLPVLTGLTLIGLVLLESRHPLPGNTAMISAGLVGATLGMVSPRLFTTGLGRWWPVPLVLYGLLAFFAHGSMSDSFLLQLTAATLALATLFGLGTCLTRPAWLVERFTMLGNYSLLAYIFQIGFLQAAVRLLGRPEPTSADFLLLFLATLLVTALAAEFTDWLRKQSKMADQAYRFVFA
jgi:hypothetical protein